MTNEMTPQQIAKIVQLLEQGTQTIDSRTLARLAESRKQAVAAMQDKVQVAQMQPAVAGWGNWFELSRYSDQRFWIMAVLLLAALAATFSYSYMHNHAPIDTDSLLLSSELPPETFADKEFVAWLDHTSRL